MTAPSTGVVNASEEPNNMDEEDELLFEINFPDFKNFTFVKSQDAVTTAMSNATAVIIFFLKLDIFIYLRHSKILI